jgi:hypothetical protein
MHKILPFFMDDRLVYLGIAGSAVCIGGIVMMNISTPIEKNMKPFKSPPRISRDYLTRKYRFSQRYR